MPALISALASEHKKTADLHAGFRMPLMEFGSTPVGLLKVGLRHMYQFFNFKQAGGDTVGVDQNDVFVWKEIHECLEYKCTGLGEMQFVQSATCINGDMDSRCNLLERSQITASSD